MAATADGSISKSDLALYRQLRLAVESAVRKNGSQFFAGRPESGLEAAGGLLNQGATCYLNSMVQALFHSTPFRQMLYRWTYDADSHGAAEDCIPLQLQRLFARLQLSQRAAASTQALTRSFGWTAAESFQQHDAQELLHVLIDALDSTATADEARVRGSEGGGSSSLEPSPLRLACDCLRGKVRDTVQCCICGFQRVREDPVLDVELTVSGNASVEQAVRQFHAVELLTGDDRWHCDRCGCRRDATKSMTLSRAPPVLMLHLKRFGFDMATMRRAKIQDAFAFPAELGLGAIVRPAVEQRSSLRQSLAAAAQSELAARKAKAAAQEKASGGGDIAAGAEAEAEAVTETVAEAEAEAEAVSDDVSASRYRLVSVLIHTGTAMGGHYFAYSRPGERFDHAEAAGLVQHAAAAGTDGRAGWVELNDAGVREIEGEHGDALLAVLAAGPEGVREAGPAGAEGAAAGAEAGRAGVRPAAGVEGNAYMLVYARTDAAGGAAGPRGAARPPESVRAEVEAENLAWGRLRRAFEVRCRLCRFDVHWPPVCNGDVGRVAAGVGAGGNAPASPASAALGPTRASSAGADSTGTSASGHAASAPPMLAAGSGSLDPAGGALEGAPSATGVEVEELEEALRAESRGSFKAAAEAGAERGVGAGAAVEVPAAWRASEALSAVVGAVGGGADVGDACGEAGLTLEAAASRGLARLRRWDAAAGRPTAALVPGGSDAVLSSLGLGAGCAVCVELRREGEEWAEYDPHAMALRLVRWLPATAGGEGGEGGLKLEERLALMPCDTVVVPGGRAATAAGLAVAVAGSALGVPATLQTLWFADGDALRRADPSDAQVVREGGGEARLCDMGLAPGMTVVVELAAGGEAPGGATSGGGGAAAAAGASAASFKASFDAEASIIEVQFNLPAGRRPAEGAGAAGAAGEPLHTAYTQRALMSKRQTLAELKAHIAAALGDGVHPEEFHLTRNARSGEQLKQLGVILGDSKPARRGRAAVAGLGLVDGSIVHVRWGRQLQRDESMVEFVWYEPAAGRRAFERICALPVRDSATVLAVKRLLRDALLQRHGVELAAARGQGSPPPAPPPPVQRLRLRDKTKSEAGKILRDPQRLRSAIPRLADGYEIAVQRLAEPETVGPGDMVVAARRWNPRTFKLSPVTELVVDKRLSVRELRAVVARKFGVRAQAAEPEPGAAAAGAAVPSGAVAGWAVSVAKHTQFARPLRGATAGAELPWAVSPEMAGWAAARGEGATRAEADVRAAEAASASAAAAAAVAEELQAAQAAAAAAEPTREELEAAAVAFGTAVAAATPDALPAGAAGAGAPIRAAGAAETRRAVVGGSARPLHEIEADVDEESVAIVAKPLALRDGVTVVVRDERAKLQADADGIKPPASAAGRGGAGGGAKKPWQRVEAGDGRASRPERGIHFRRNAGGEGSAPQQAARTWSCATCTFEQTNAATSCEMCGAAGSSGH